MTRDRGGRARRYHRQIDDASACRRGAATGTRDLLVVSLPLARVQPACDFWSPFGENTVQRRLPQEIQPQFCLTPRPVLSVLPNRQPGAHRGHQRPRGQQHSSRLPARTGTTHTHAQLLSLADSCARKRQGKATLPEKHGCSSWRLSHSGRRCARPLPRQRERRTAVYPSPGGGSARSGTRQE